MKLVTYTSSRFYVDDWAAACLVEYTMVLASERRADAVTLRALDQYGDEVDVTLVLNEATQLASMSSIAPMQPPANDSVASYMMDRMQAIRDGLFEHHDFHDGGSERG